MSENLREPTARDLSAANDREQSRCRRGRHYFPPFKESDHLSGSGQRCECGICLIDRSLDGGRVLEIPREAERDYLLARLQELVEMTRGCAID